jgi:hypothetical protein
MRAYYRNLLLTSPIFLSVLLVPMIVYFAFGGKPDPVDAAFWVGGVMGFWFFAVGMLTP